MRSIWSGSLTFGLVNIPIKLYVATEEKSLDLDMLHKKDLSPIRFARICKSEEKEVPYEQIIKGYEINKDDYVILTPEELKKANVKKTQSIEILQFIKEDEIDSMYFEKPYYLEPEKGAQKSYTLLLEALKKAKKVGIAKYVLRTRERMAIIKPHDNVLVAEQMRYHQEIRSTKELNLPEKEAVGEKEVNMALTFIEQLTEKFKPEQFRDTYKEELERLIEAKSKGETVSVKGKEPVPTKMEDLMSLLKESVEQQRSVH
jgi:DNA end-binding protein Ku